MLSKTLSGIIWGCGQLIWKGEVSLCTISQSTFRLAALKENEETLHAFLLATETKWAQGTGRREGRWELSAGV